MTTTKPTLPTPLLLPAGSVRAAMAVFISVTLWALLLNGRQPPTVLVDAALLIVVFYFGVRSGVLASQPASGTRHPLLLPRRSVRLFLFAGFLLTALALGYPARTVSALSEILTVLLSYVAGWLISNVLQLPARTDPVRSVRWLRHGMALAILLVTLTLCASIYFTPPTWFPAWLFPESLLTAIVAFYFGWRLVP